MNQTDSNEPIALDRRSEPRERLLVRARIVVGDSVHDCILLDQTACGARLETLLPLPLPERFGLRFTDGRQVECERRWGIGRRMGVRILKSKAVPAAPKVSPAVPKDGVEGLVQAYDAMGIDRFFDLLRSANYLQSASLGEAAWQAESTMRRLGIALHGLATAGPAIGPAAPEGRPAGSKAVN